jgi:hypothetical protein
LKLVKGRSLDGGFDGMTQFILSFPTNGRFEMTIINRNNGKDRKQQPFGIEQINEVVQSLYRKSFHPLAF